MINNLDNVSINLIRNRLSNMTGKEKTKLIVFFKILFLIFFSHNHIILEIFKELLNFM